MNGGLHRSARVQAFEFGVDQGTRCVEWPLECGCSADRSLVVRILTWRHGVAYCVIVFFAEFY